MFKLFRFPSLGRKPVPGLLIAISQTLLTWMVLGSVLGVVLVVSWWRLRAEIHDVAGAVAVRLSLPPDITEGLSEVMAVYADAPIAEAAALVVKFLPLLLTNLLILDLVRLLVSSAMGKAVRDLRGMVDPTDPLDKRMAFRFFGVASAAAVLVIAAFLAILRVVQLSTGQFAGVGAVLVMAYAILLAGVLAIMSRRHLRRHGVYHEYVAHATSQRKRYRAYAQFISVLACIWFFSGIALPVLFREANELPKRISENIRVQLEVRKANEIRDRVVSFLDQRASELNDPDLAAANYDLEFHIGWDDEPFLEGEEEAIAVFVASLLSLAAIFFFLIAILPRMLIVHAKAGWHGLYQEIPRLLRRAMPAVPAIIVMLMLDQQGVTSERPLLWLAVIPLVAVTDWLLSDPVSFAPRGKKYHRSRHRPALRLTQIDRLRLRRWRNRARTKEGGTT